jgi:predicted MFS family arabinose efflux permease
MLAFALLFQSIPPILPLIIFELHLTYAQSGLLMSLFALPGIFASFGGGFLSDRYRMKPLGLACLLIMVGGTLLVGWGRNLWIMWLGRIIGGIGGFTLSTLLPKLLSQWFKDKELGLAMGVFNTGVPLAAVICFGLFGKIGSLWGWRIPILLTGIYSFIASIFFLRCCRLPSSQEMERTGSPGIYNSLKEIGPPILGAGLSWLWFNAGLISFSTFAPTFFLHHGYTIEQSDLLVGILFLGSLFLSTPTGYLIDRFKRQEWFIGIGGLALSILTVCFNLGSAFLLLIILMSIFAALIPAPIYSLPPEIMRPENVGLGFGIISSCSGIGIFIGPYLVGKAKDLTGSDLWSFVLISIFFLFAMISIAFTYLSRNKRSLKK